MPSWQRRTPAAGILLAPRSCSHGWYTQPVGKEYPIPHPQGRGFLLGAKAGRTALQGEGLQHDDGYSHLRFSVVENVQAYDPACADEAAVIIRDGLTRMVENNENCFYYMTLYNENYEMPAMPDGAAEGIVRGLYKARAAEGVCSHRVQLVGSGTVLRKVLQAATSLQERFGVGADVWSATSSQRLRADALAAERWNRLHSTQVPRLPFVTAQLAASAVGDLGLDPEAADPSSR